MSKYYYLDGHEAKPCDMHTWVEHGLPHVAFTKIGAVDVSTVFLGLDHQFGEGPPLLFETMVFGGPLDEEQRRYTTWAEAEAGHAEMVAHVEQTGGE